MSPFTDLRYAARALRRRPGFAAAAMLTIAVAIAANTTIFSVVDAVLLKPLPYRDPNRLVTLDVLAPTGFYISTSIPNYRDWRDRARSFDAYGASAGWGMTLTGAGPAEVVRGRAVLGEFFEVLGLVPALGRTITGSETEQGSAPVVVLGHGYWTRRFGGDSTIVGSTLTMDSRSYTVVGVMPAGSGYPSAATDMYFNMGSMPDLPWDDPRSGFGTSAIARLAPGITVDAARADVARIGREVEEVRGEPTPQPELRTLEDLFVGDVTLQLWVLMGAVGFVLLIATANVGNLLLARGEDRRRELAVRTALGATRGMIVRSLMVESLLIAVGGGAIGLLLAALGIRGAVAFLPDAVPQSLIARIGVDGRVVLFTAGATMLSVLLFGLVPSIRASRLQLGHELKAGDRGSSGGRGRLRNGLIVGEVALSMVLLIGAGLMVRSFVRLQHVDKGFRSEGVLSARIAPPGDRYDTKVAWEAFFSETLRRAEQFPGVRSAALSLLVPLSDRSWELRAQPEDAPYESNAGESVLYGVVSEDYFATLDVPILRGRGFEPTDRDGATPVAIIDETMAERFWPGQDPIGKRVTIEEAEGSTHERPIPVYRTVVGVTRNVRHYAVAEPSRVQIYVPFGQSLRRWGMSLYVLLRTTVPPENVIEPLRREVQLLDAEAPLYQVSTLQQYVDADLAGSRSLTELLALFGALAASLAAIGVFGVMSYLVAQRTREIGIRMALGADAAKVVRWISGSGFRLALLGVAIGTGAAALLSRFLTRFLYEVQPIDPVVYGLLAAMLLLTATLAAYLPARRATRVDPAVVLKHDG